jgi:hypothetical protein
MTIKLVRAVFAESSPNPEEALAFLENYPGKALAWDGHL